MERETGIEPATNSLEGCDSTTELLPPTCSPASSLSHFGGQARLLLTHYPTANAAREARASTNRISRPSARPPARSGHHSLSPARACHERGPQGRVEWWGGEGSNLRSPKAAGLQPAAIDRSATSPNSFVRDIQIPLRAQCLADVIHESLFACIDTVYRGIRVCSALP
jgi:hypothetical protein